MKKIVALLVALMMLAGVVAAVAETPSKESPEDTVVLTGEGTIDIVWTDEEIGESLDPLAGAVKNKTNPLDVLPKEIRDQLPAGFTVVNEIGNMKIEGDTDAVTEDVKVAIKFDTPYEADSVVYLAIAIPGEEVEWVLLEGKANQDQNVEVTFDVETIKKIGSKIFKVMAISEK